MTGMYRTVRFAPDWFPGAGWKTKAKRWADILTEMADVPHQFVKDQMVSRRSCWNYRVLSTTHGCKRRRENRMPTAGECYLLPIIGFDSDELCIDIRYRRPPERPFHPSRPSSSAVRRSPQRSNLTSSGRLLLYTRVRLTRFIW